MVVQIYEGDNVTQNFRTNRFIRAVGHIRIY